MDCAILCAWPTRTSKNTAKSAKKSPSSCALPMFASVNERLGDVLSYHDVIPLVDEYLAAIPVDLDDPSFLFDWDAQNVDAFVDAANNMNPLPPLPPWLRTLPPTMTPVSFVDDLLTSLEPVAGGRCGNFMLAPNTVQQFAGIVCRLTVLQSTPFLQQVARVALPVVNGVERHLARTLHQTDRGGVHLTRPNALPHPRGSEQPPVPPVHTIRCVCSTDALYRPSIRSWGNIFATYLRTP